VGFTVEIVAVFGAGSAVPESDAFVPHLLLLIILLLIIIVWLGLTIGRAGAMSSKKPGFVTPTITNGGPLKTTGKSKTYAKKE